MTGRIQRNAAEFRNTVPAIHETQPGELAEVIPFPARSAPACPPCTGNCRQGRDCPVAIAEADRRLQAAIKAYGTPTTRRYSRTLADAFADVRAQCIDGPFKRPIPWREVGLEGLLWVAMAVVFTAPFWWHLVAKALR